MIILESAYPVLSCVLGWAVLGKLGRLPEFTRQVADYRLLPAALVGPAALAVVFGEAAGAVLLVPPVTRVYGAALATLLLTVYLAAQVSAVASWPAHRLRLLRRLERAVGDRPGD